jgi:nucleoside-diphosphate-sugar epimerase
MNAYGAHEVARRAGGFEMWRSIDGEHWIPVTTTGFGNPYNYGGRTLVSTREGLLVGTANPFAPETPTRMAGGWQYAPNPGGGAEVWRGSAPPAHARLTRQKMCSRDIALTGATGLVGSRLLEHLLGRGAGLRVLIEPGTLGALPHRAHVEVVEGYLHDEEALRKVVRGVEVVVHLAGLLPGSLPLDLHHVNVAGTAALLHACRRAVPGPRRFVLMSSTAVYAGVHDPQQWPLTESSRCGPETPGLSGTYGWSKVAAERLVQEAGLSSGWESLVVRAPACYGPNAPFTERLLRSALAGPIDAGSHRVCQYIHVDDLAELLALLVYAPRSDAVVHLAGPDAMSWSSVQSLARSAAGAGPVPVAAPLSRWSYPYDISRARRLGAMPRTTMREGLLDLLREQARLATPVFSGEG